MIEIIESFIANQPWNVQKQKDSVISIQRTFNDGTDVMLKVCLLKAEVFLIEETIEHRMSGPYNRELSICHGLAQLQNDLAKAIRDLEGRFGG
jgi:hypothetical protein